MSSVVTRRGLILGSGATAFVGLGYGAWRAVKRVQDAAGRSTSQ